MADAFHEVRFPIPLGLGAKGGPERRTEIVALASGHEERNARRADSRRRWNLGSGLRSLADLETLVAFFEERRGRLTGFRFRDPLDWTSSPLARAPAATDQALGTGDGARRSFALVKTYGGGFAPYARPIMKPVAGSVLVAVNGVATDAATVDATTGLVTFAEGAAPAAGASVTAGFAFDVAVRFDADRLDIDLAAFEAGEALSVPIVEIRP